MLWALRLSLLTAFVLLLSLHDEWSFSLELPEVPSPTNLPIYWSSLLEYLVVDSKAPRTVVDILISPECVDLGV